MKSLYYYPSAPREGYGNPYSEHVKAALEHKFRVLDADNKPSRALSLGLLKHCCQADVFLLNWIEGIGKAKWGSIQFFLILFCLYIIWIRRAKLIWTLHNLQPHEGQDKRSNFIQQFLFRHAHLIICHSRDAEIFAGERSSRRVIYICHPITPLPIAQTEVLSLPCDILIWGQILPYKGVAEFLEQIQTWKKTFNIHIVGQCKDEQLLARIKNAQTQQTQFINKRIDFGELKARIAQSKFVLFPYIGNCISSSGALMDTIALGGTPIGPHKGAFKDLAEEGVCLTYKNYEDLLYKLSNPTMVTPATREKFIATHSWKQFAEKIYDESI